MSSVATGDPSGSTTTTDAAPNSSLTSAQELLTSKGFLLGDLPRRHDDPMWAEIRSEFGLSLGQVCALKNSVCVTIPVAAVAAAPPTQAVASTPAVVIATPQQAVPMGTVLSAMPPQPYYPAYNNAPSTNNAVYHGAGAGDTVNPIHGAPAQVGSSRALAAPDADPAGAARRDSIKKQADWADVSSMIDVS
jgi:hypothetical protein